MPSATWSAALIQTAAGQTITLTLDTDSPHPYSRNTFVQGTKGLVRKYPDEKVFIDGRNRRPGAWEGEWDWEPLEAFRSEYEHPLWKELAEKAKGAGHGGMDYIECYRLIDALCMEGAAGHGCLRRGRLECGFRLERAVDCGQGSRR